MTAYHETYLSDAMECLGEAFDVAVNSYGVQADRFYEMFQAGGFAERFQSGDASVISGITGRDLAERVISKAGLTFVCDKEMIAFDRTPEFWAGWVLAYYQYSRCQSFRVIHKVITMDALTCLYRPYHEADEEKVCELIDGKFRELGRTSLQRMRRWKGLSQSGLAKASGVGIRTLQQYELGNRELIKASYETVRRLSACLDCTPDELCAEID